MKAGLRRGVELTAVFAAAALSSGAQAAGGNPPASSATPAASTPAQAAALGEVFREIDDPETGARWLLVRDARHPSGPGRFVFVEGHGKGCGCALLSGGRQLDMRLASAARFRPVIHAGETVVVEEHTAVVEARLEAVALGPAVPGGIFEARLKIGGKVVRAVALEAGRAAFADQIGARP